MKVRTNNNGIKQLEKLGFEKIPTEDGFTMYELNPSKLIEKKQKKAIETKVRESLTTEKKDV